MKFKPNQDYFLGMQDIVKITRLIAQIYRSIWLNLQSAITSLSDHLVDLALTLTSDISNRTPRSQTDQISLEKANIEYEASGKKSEKLRVATVKLWMRLNISLFHCDCAESLHVSVCIHVIFEVACL